MPGEPKIKLCPFCGGTAAVVRGWKYDSSRAIFKVYCKRCQVRQPFHKTKIGAISEWNHRAILVVKNGSSHNTQSNQCVGSLKHTPKRNRTESRTC